MAEPPRDRDHLLVQLHHNPGTRLATESLVPAAGPEGRSGRVAFGYLGDIQLRFVFEHPGEGPSSPVRPEDLQRLDLTPARALAIAALNARKLCGSPDATDQGAGVGGVRGAHLEYILSYLLDRSFWRKLLAQHPKGLVVALPRRGLLLFAALDDVAARTELVRRAMAQVKLAGAARVSDCVYRFDGTGWHLAGELPGTKPEPTPAPATAAVQRPRRIEEDDDEEAPAADEDAVDPLEQAVSAHRMLLHGLGAGAVLLLMQGFGITPTLTLLLWLGATSYTLLGVVRACAATERPTEFTLGCMVASWVPLLNLGLWAWLRREAAQPLRDAGWQVNWLGARP